MCKGERKRHRQIQEEKASTRDMVLEIDEDEEKQVEPVVTIETNLTTGGRDR